MQTIDKRINVVTKRCRRKITECQWAVLNFAVTITSLALELPRKSVKHSLVTVSSYRSATSYKNVLSSHDRLALTLQQSTDRLNNHSRSLGSLELIIKKKKFSK